MRVFFKLIFVLLISFLFLGEAWAKPTKIAKPMKVKLPKKIKKLMESKYPGFRFVNKKDYCDRFTEIVLALAAVENGWSYNLVAKDVNKDGIKDYSAIIQYKDRYHWIAIVSGRPEKESKIINYYFHDFGEPVYQREYFPYAHLGKNKICDGVLVVSKSEYNGKIYFGLEGPAVGTQKYWSRCQGFDEISYEP